MFNEQIEDNKTFDNFGIQFFTNLFLAFAITIYYLHNLN